MIFKIFFYKTNEEYGFCSNFYKHSVEIDGKIWPTTEHYFQACKFLNEDYKEEIRCAYTPAQAKKLGNSRKYKIREDWEDRKIEVMIKAVVYKFSDDILKKRLLSIPDETLLCEHCHDMYWGDGMGPGENILGRILTGLRYILKYGDMNSMSEKLRNLVRFNTE